VAPAEPKRRAGRLTQPADPSRGVSREEFDEMVRDLDVQKAPEEEPQPAATGSRPRGGRRARSRAEGGSQPPAGGDDKPKKPRNRRHGRPR
jgi:SecD/SecF fusion protein